MTPMDEDGAMPSIALTPLEDAIVTLLADTCAWIGQTHPQPPAELAPPIEYTEAWEVTARIAGGWVRDRLLSQASHDLDISLSSLTGHTFALLLSAYLQSSQFAASPLASHPALTEKGLEAKSMGTVAKIVANPEQSKTLETATANVLGLALDFVNLRKEVYQEGSRIPIMSFGTPHEDAERRDTTINSLFFNVHTRRVEDWTRQGLPDLRDGLIRTPLPALRTFLDDPLRVLRCVRFAARFGYRLDAGITQCLGGEQGESVRSALAGKVSRERFGIEVDKMLGGPEPHRALHLLEALQLFGTTFMEPLELPLRQLKPGTTNAFPAQLSSEAEPASSRVALRASRILDALWRSEACGGPSRSSHAGEEAGIPPLPPSPLPAGLVEAVPVELLAPLREEGQRRRLFLAAALLPLRGLAANDKGNKWCWSGEHIIANGLKLGKANTRDPEAALARAIDMLETPSLDSFEPSHAQYRGKWIAALEPQGVSPKATMGLLLQHPTITYAPHALSIAPALLFSLVAELVKRWEAHDTSAAKPGSAATDAQALPESAVEVAQVYAAFWRQANEWHLVQRAEEKPILDGKEIAETLAFQPGQLTKRIQTSILAWQLDRTAASSAEQEQSEKQACQTWLRETWEKGGIVPHAEREIKGAKAKKGKTANAQQGGRAAKRQKSEE